MGWLGDNRPDESFHPPLYESTPVQDNFDVKFEDINQGAEFVSSSGFNDLACNYCGNCDHCDRLIRGSDVCTGFYEPVN